MSIYILCLPTRDEHLRKSRFYQNKNSTSKSNKNSIKTIKLIDYENEVYMKNQGNFYQTSWIHSLIDEGWNLDCICNGWNFF